MRPADPTALGRQLHRALAMPGATVGLVGQFLRRRVPIHFGGMSDPFEPIEVRMGISQAFLRALMRYRYPTVISTRSTLPAVEPYLSLLRELGHVVVQFSFSSSRDSVSKLVEPHAPLPSARLRVMDTLARRGINVTSRWQPLIPGLSEEPAEFVGRMADAGSRHVGIEHLKLPVERSNPLWLRLAAAVGGRDLRREYLDKGAFRDGREYVLPTEAKLAGVLAVAGETHRLGMTFGAADNDLQYLSDTHCCCSGADQFVGFENWFRHQIGYAVRKCRGRRRIVYESIAKEWCPDGSVDRFLNSRSRIGMGGRKGAGVREHIVSRWNDPATSGSPASFYGVVATGERSADGNLKYRWVGATQAPLRRECEQSCVSGSGTALSGGRPS